MNLIEPDKRRIIDDVQTTIPLEALAGYFSQEKHFNTGLMNAAQAAQTEIDRRVAAMDTPAKVDSAPTHSQTDAVCFRQALTLSLALNQASKNLFSLLGQKRETVLKSGTLTDIRTNLDAQTKDGVTCLHAALLELVQETIGAIDSFVDGSTTDIAIVIRALGTASDEAVALSRPQ